MQRVKNRSGCGCCGCGSIRVTVSRCAPSGFTYVTALRPGATVNVYDDAEVLVGTAITDAAGVAEIDIPSAGDYRISVTYATDIPVWITVAATCTTNNVATTLNQGVRVFVGGCGCPTPGVTVRLTRASPLPAIDETAVTTAAGNVIFPMPSPEGNPVTIYTTAPSGYAAEAVATPTPLGIGACDVQVSVTLDRQPHHWCYGGNPGICLGPMPASIDVTCPNDAIFGSYAGATLTVPRNGSDQFKYGFAPSSGVWGGHSHFGIELFFDLDGTCNTPTGRISWYGASNAAGAFAPGPEARASMSAGTAGCPVAFSCSQFQYISGGSSSFVTAASTAAE